MNWKIRRGATLLMGMAFTLVSPLVSFAGEVTYSFPAEPAITKTIQFQLEGGADEYRIRKGNFEEDGFFDARSVGGGDGAEITVKENGVYTLYAKQDGNIYFVQVPVTMIDHTPPTIRIIDIVSTDEKRISVYYEVDDYYGVNEVRYIKGNVPVSEYSRAEIAAGGMITELQEGTYTLFAKDLAGNITAYVMAVTCDYSETQQSNQYESRSETHQSTEWAKSDLWVEPSSAVSPESSTPEPPPTVTEIEPEPPPTVTEIEPEPTPPRELVTDSDQEPEETTAKAPETGPEETFPVELVPTNPTEPPSRPPVERYPQTGSLLAERLLRTFSITFLFLFGCGLLLMRRILNMREKGGEGKKRHEG